MHTDGNVGGASSYIECVQIRSTGMAFLRLLAPKTCQIFQNFQPPLTLDFHCVSSGRIKLGSELFWVLCCCPNVKASQQRMNLSLPPQQSQAPGPLSFAYAGPEIESCSRFAFKTFLWLLCNWCAPWNGFFRLGTRTSLCALLIIFYCTSQYTHLLCL